MCNFTLSLTSALDGVDGQIHTLVALTPCKTQYPLYKLCRPHDWSGQVWKIATPLVFDPWTVQPVVLLQMTFTYMPQ
jgi:hypothetical protein